VSGARLKGVAAGALQFDRLVLRVNSLFWHDSLSLLGHGSLMNARIAPPIHESLPGSVACWLAVRLQRSVVTSHRFACREAHRAPVFGKT
jgi:hypothetical protein